MSGAHVLNWVESLVPGTRSVRAPLIAGILWGLFVWVLVADAIPMPDEAAGWPEQAYKLAGAAGALPTSAVVAVLIFVVGAIATTLTGQLAAALGNLALRVQSEFAWHRHARRALGRLEREHDEARQLLAGGPSGGHVEMPENQESALEKKRDELDDKLKEVKSSIRWRYHVPRTRDLRRILGTPGPESDIDLEFELVEQVRLQALDAAIQETDAPTSLHDVDHATGGSDWDSVERLRREFQQDPLDVLRVIDEQLFLELDRERSEREVRQAASLPLAASAVFAAVVWSFWWLLLAVAAALVFIYTAARQSQERSRVMNVVSIRGLDEMPSLRLAAARGRDQLRHYQVQRQTTQEAPTGSN